jgi:hypothetical protein
VGGKVKTNVEEEEEEEEEEEMEFPRSAKSQVILYVLFDLGTFCRSFGICHFSELYTLRRPRGNVIWGLAFFPPIFTGLSTPGVYPRT